MILWFYTLFWKMADLSYSIFHKFFTENEFKNSQNIIFVLCCTLQPESASEKFTFYLTCLLIQNLSLTPLPPVHYHHYSLMCWSVQNHSHCHWIKQIFFWTVTSKLSNSCSSDSLSLSANNGCYGVDAGTNCIAY